MPCASPSTSHGLLLHPVTILAARGLEQNRASLRSMEKIGNQLRKMFWAPTESNLSFKIKPVICGQVPGMKFLRSGMAIIGRLLTWATWSKKALECMEQDAEGTYWVATE